MPRPKSESYDIHLRVPLDLKSRLDLLLYSEVEKRVPFGHYNAFFTDRLREFLNWQVLDLSPYGFPPGYIVKGPKEMINSLKSRLENEQDETLR